MWVPKKSRLGVALTAMVVESMKKKAEKNSEMAEEEADDDEEEAEEAERREVERRRRRREETKRALDLAIGESVRAGAKVDSLRLQLAQHTALEGLKRKRSSAKEAEEAGIVMVDDREFKEAMGVYDGGVHYVTVERYEQSGPGGIGPVRGGKNVMEGVYDGAEADELLAECTGGGGAVVEGRKGVRKFDDMMEENGFCSAGD